MNTDHAKEHARLTKLALYYEIKARIHSGDSQGVWFWCMSRSKELQSIWHKRRIVFGTRREMAGKFVRIEGSKTIIEANYPRAFTEETNIAQVIARAHEAGRYLTDEELSRLPWPEGAE